MRVVDAAALTAAALLLSSTMASAQGIGDVAAKEREKRKANPPPAKVITDTDIEKPAPQQQPWGRSTDGSEVGGSYSGTGVAAAPAGSAPSGTTADGAKPDEKKPPTIEELMAKEEEERNKAQQEWRAQVDAAQKDVEAHQQNVGRLTDQLNDFRYGFNTPTVVRAQQDLETEKTKLAESQAALERLQDQGRREGYR